MFKKKTICLILYLILSCGFPLLGWAAEKPLSVRAGVLAGFDNNTGLNAQRNKDGYAQESVSVAYQHLFNKKLKGRLSYAAINLNYADSDNQDFLAHDVSADLDYLLTPQTIVEANYGFQYLDFYMNNAVNSFENSGRLGVKQKLNSQWLLKAGAAISQRDYTERKLRMADAVLSDNERSDDRLTLDSSVIFKWSKELAFNLGTVYYWNDSNDAFHDYYDYESFKAIAGASWQVVKRVTLSAKFIYETREYDSRPLKDAINVFQEDDIYTANLALYFKLTKDLTMGTAYSYRQKNSNEPAQKYSGSTGTLGLYYSY